MDANDKIKEQDRDKLPRVRERMPRGGGYSVGSGEDISLKSPRIFGHEVTQKMKNSVVEYDVVDRDSVSAYIARHLGLTEPLRDAPAYIRKVWGQDVAINLEVSKDPEGEQYDSLMAYIQTSDDPDTAMAKLNAFGSEWWNQYSASYRNLLDFDVEIRDAI
jgi:nucleoside diphosphate kinase